MHFPAFLHLPELPPLLLIGVLVGVSFYVGKLGRFVKLPSIIGYMIVGVLAGPSLLRLCGEQELDSLGFISEIALGFVAFTIGSELSIKALRRLGKGIGLVIIAESFGAFVAVFGGVYLLTRDLPLSLVFAAMAPASAPAGTVAVIQECKARGKLTTALYAVVGFDDGLAIILFGFAFAMAKAILHNQVSPGASAGFIELVVTPLRELGFSCVIGAVLGFAFGFLVRRLKHQRDIRILAFAFVMVATGISGVLHLSLILTNLTIGFVLVNTRREDLVRKVASEVTEALPLLFILFFSLAGAHLKIEALPSLGLVGLIYIITRSGGLIGGSFLGALLGRADRVIRKYIGLGILSQAGVAIGLALIVKNEFDQISAHAGALGTSVLATVTATCIVFEIVGPVLTRVALTKAGEIDAAGKLAREPEPE